MTYPTPYYVIDKEALENGICKLKNALDKYWGNSIIGYSYKTNSLPWIIKFYKDKGCYAEVVSDDEYLLAQSIKTEPGRIIYNGMLKSKETFLEAIQNRCIVNIDSQREIDWLEELPGDGGFGVGIRVNFDIEKYCPNQSACGAEGGRFGFCYENGEFEKALNRIISKNIKVDGLHLHVSSKTRSVDIYKAIANVACEIVNRYGLELSYIDIGGGFFGGLENKPQFNDYIEAVSNILKETVQPHQTTLIVEPGMSLIGPSISYETTVIDIKDTTYGRFVITDGSRMNIDPLMTKKNYFYHYKLRDNCERVNLPKQVICGYTCIENDRLFELENEKELLVGDKLIYDKVGAYTMCLTPLFIKYFPDVYLKDGENMKLVMERWLPENYVQNER